MILKYVAFYTDMSEYEFDLWMDENKSLADMWESAVSKAITERPFMEGMTTVKLVAAEVRSGNK